MPFTVILETLFSRGLITSSGGLAGYDVCLTRIRSRVRAPPGVLFFFSVSTPINMFAVFCFYPQYNLRTRREKYTSK